MYHNWTEIQISIGFSAYKQEDCFLTDSQNSSDVKNICGCFFKCVFQQLQFVSGWGETNFKRDYIGIKNSFEIGLSFGHFLKG